MVLHRSTRERNFDGLRFRNHLELAWHRDMVMRPELAGVFAIFQRERS
jgi:hypothetical protein